MAQKSMKVLAARNQGHLQRLRLITAITHGIFFIARLLFHRKAFFASPIRSTLPYILLSIPAIAVQLFFESVSRPRHAPDGRVVRAGEDLDQKGLTEYGWDIIYWTDLCVVLAGLFGNNAFWLWIAVPIYLGGVLVRFGGKMMGWF
ncbi:hypothetical protein P152DRAFT_471340 [Eremomyces bilateralis CBS 781.70]|uniref:DUF788-domain-containing protein n=1 Tax=Eremomyces bilateralis CBS 781.70 TaxID=1392243 RepID=A0A6G1GDJ1_9PEZI|nr:uncharacterized protein P152DRAFT_471340 [Eremomyces bilateralis CBS 781.70]KAF1815980.1 hypothetical protein P152DRAFT_471340 [Eremomyces bilateralis CBS 781.70]